jgi:formylglycine-generating enzyme required for sulfatase activity
MKANARIATWCITGLLLATQSMGQVPVITDLNSNGRVTWTNAINTDAIYRIEWSSQAGGPWNSFTYQPMNTIDALDETTFEAEVPMFYRVVMVTNTVPLGMVWIDAGEAHMQQSDTDKPDGGMVYTNYVSGFWMDAMEVGKHQWEKVYNWAITNGYDFANTGQGKGSAHPVHSVNWYDAVKWCNARSEMDGLAPVYLQQTNPNIVYRSDQHDLSNEMVLWDANGYRLPTEAEWEKAARGGRQRRAFPWGSNTITHEYANYWASTNIFSYDANPTQEHHPLFDDGEVPYTSPRGFFPANGYGLYDMAGNVFEWCWDWYADLNTEYEMNPSGPNSGQYGVYRIYRGGSWATYAAYTRSGDRGYGSSFYQPFHASHIVGFRCVRRP